MSQELPHASSRELRRLDRRIILPDIRSKGITPESLEKVGIIADRVQEILEDVYGLKRLKLKKASQFLWPRVTSEETEEAMPRYGDNGAFYIDDGDPNFHIVMAYFHRKPLTERMKHRAKQLRFEAGLLPFESLHPVIYIGPSIMARVESAEFADLLKEEKLPDLEAISEEVGHFLYHQSQYKHNSEFAGSIMVEAMSLVDWYQTLKRVVSDTTGKSVFDSNNQLAQAAARSLSEKISSRLIAPHISLNPITSKYNKGPRIMRGYLEHLVHLDRSRITQDEELKKFYLLTGGRKIGYLINLYQGFSNQGNIEFSESLDYLKNSASLEPEFGRRLK